MIKLTDQYFTYREYPLDYDGAGKVYLKGNSIGWNQLRSPIVGSSTPSGITGTFTADGKCVFTGTSTGANVFVLGRNIPMHVNHKYLILFDKTLDANRNIQLRYSSDGTTDSGGYLANIYNSTIFTYTNSTYPYVLLRFYFGNGITLNDTFYISMYDLTMIFGSGKEPSSVAEFKQYFPLNYYTYTQGTLVNFNGTGIKTVGKNLLRIMRGSEITYNGITYTPSSDGIVLNGTSTALSYYVFASGNGNYALSDFGTALYYTGTTIKTSNTPTNVTLNFRYTDGTYENGCQNRTITLTKDVGLVYLQVNTATLSFDNVNVQPMICFSDADMTFEPYKESTSDLSTLTYFPNGMKSAGSIYDEITGSKAITRVGSVALSSSFSWVRTSANNFYFALSSVKRSADYRATMTCDKLDVIQTGSDTTTSTSPRWISAYVQNASYPGQNWIYIHIDGITTIADLQTWLDNNPTTVNYELSTYSETEVSDDFVYLGYADGTEQLLPINGATPTTSPLFADIEYYTLMDSEIPYRKFWIINNSNEQWDLTEKDFKAFLNNPTGLGFKKTIEMTRYGEKAVKNNETYDFPSVQGELLFYDSANSNRYDKYNQFVRFVMDTPLKLYYQIPVSISSQIADIYSMDCEITELQKTESKPDRLLRSTVTFNGLSFYEGEEITISGSGSSYTIENKGDFPVGFEITVEGSLTNPYITLEQDGELYGEAKFDDSTAFSSVYVNSNDGEQNVILQQSDAVLPNPLSYQDLSISNGSIYVTFVKLARGSSTLTIGMDSGSITSVSIKYTPQYRSV